MIECRMKIDWWKLLAEVLRLIAAAISGGLTASYLV